MAIFAGPHRCPARYVCVLLTAHALGPAPRSATDRSKAMGAPLNVASHGTILTTTGVTRTTPPEVERLSREGPPPTCQ